MTLTARGASAIGATLLEVLCDRGFASAMQAREREGTCGASSALLDRKLSPTEEEIAEALSLPAHGVREDRRGGEERRQCLEGRAKSGDSDRETGKALRGGPRGRRQVGPQSGRHGHGLRPRPGRRRPRPGGALGRRHVPSPDAHARIRRIDPHPAPNPQDARGRLQLGRNAERPANEVLSNTGA